MTLTAIPETRPRVNLAGKSAYAALAACLAAARYAGWSNAEIRAFRLRATSGSLDDVLQVCRQWFEAL